MIGNFLLLLASWLLLRLEKKNLRVLGLSPTVERGFEILLGFLVTAFLAILLALLLAFVAQFVWLPNESMLNSIVFRDLFNSFQTVFYEELLFRGYLLYKAITLLGDRKANMLSAVAFGMYHWFSFGVFGNPLLMLWVLFYMGLWGLMLAYAYSRTGSLALPIGLHWGWYFIQHHVFNEQGSGFFTAVTNIHTMYLSNLESMLYLRLPIIAFSVILVVFLAKLKPKVGKVSKIKSKVSR
ncbi:CPBP family intramembrane glutamic endopeptidase [Pontibacter harenae]|uniref:CPBP family intramembrane glutamic endopeptidase n=1 Tax=Pontibacter harenae TaxID=2894083 RepID=UPI001E5C6F1E|nr:CPBP family intramembrane glutamic endopeptidase [Pontibacter harenae]MCC9165483.1 CPBP family intramembrane metalloprotease [Pontibacter harenae]